MEIDKVDLFAILWNRFISRNIYSKFFNICKKKGNLNQIKWSYWHNQKFKAHELKIYKIASLKKNVLKKARLILCGNGGSASDASPLLQN